MRLCKAALPLGLVLALAVPFLTRAADPSTTNPNPTAQASPAMSSQQDVQAMESRVRELRELFNRLELQAEQTKSQIDRAKPQAISFGQGELKLVNSMAWPTFNSSSGAQALLGFNLNPSSEVNGTVQMELLGPVAVDRLMPQREVTLALTNQWALIRKGEIKFENDEFMARAFRAVPRPDLYEEGDMLHMFPAADDTNKYFRQSGRAAPNGFQFLAKDGLGIAKGFEVWAGDELVYGANPMAFARYKRTLGPIDFSLMGLWQSDPTYASGSNMTATQEGWVRLPLFEGENLDLVGARQAARVGQKYTIVNQVAPGSGTSGTNYLVETKATTESDAWAGFARFTGRKDIPGLEEEGLSAAYGGPLALNELSFGGLLSARPQRYLLLSVEAGWQKPTLGVNPTVMVGTPSLSLGVLPGTGPRPDGAIGAVIDDPVSGINNREMTWITTTIEFNPGQGWFYKYRPRVVEDWNFNNDLKTPFSSAVSVRLFNCPTGTDLTHFYNASGTVVSEGPGSSGGAPTKGWLYNVNDITALSVGAVQSWLEITTGQQIAGLGFSSAVVPANTYFTSALSARYKATTISGGYAEDIYGPDDWYRTFGIIIGNQYKASLTYTFGNSDISIQYEGWRDKDPSKYHNPVNTVVTAAGTLLIEPTIDQVMTTYTVRF